MTLDAGSDTSSASIERRRVVDSAVWTMNALATGAAIVAAIAWLFALASATGRVASPYAVLTVGIACTATVCLVLFLLTRHLITLQRHLVEVDDRP